jgi:ferredoxin like protein
MAERQTRVLIVNDGSIAVQHAACLECGTCLALAAPGTLRWHCPAGGFGVVFREG